MQDLVSTYKSRRGSYSQRGVYLCISAADCLPITVYDLVTKAVGLIHVLKHNLKKIIRDTSEELKKKFNANFRNLIVHIGPSIGPCHYKSDLWKIAEEELRR